MTGAIFFVAGMVAMWNFARTACFTEISRWFYFADAVVAAGWLLWAWAVSYLAEQAIERARKGKVR